jgi:hypothetical protein
MWLYAVSALVIIAVVIAIIYGYHPFGKTKSENLTAPAAVDTNVETETKPAVVEPTRPTPEAMTAVPPGPTVESNPRAAELISEAMTYLNAKPARIIDARTRLNEALPMPMSRQQRVFVKEQILQLAGKWLFSRTIFPQDELCGSYTVRPGEMLSAIGRRFKVPHEILMEINNIPVAEALQAAETIKIINGPFHAVVYRSAFTMDLYLQNTFVKSFPVGLGKSGMETPTGLWLVKPGGKLISPTWTDSISGKTYEAEDPDYPLGSRWIGLEGVGGQAKGRIGFAIHGTKSPEEIGTAGSQGCIRLHNGDAILVYNLLMPGFSKVQVVE